MFSRFNRLTATGYFCYLRSVHGLVAEHWHNLPFRQELLSLSPQTLSLLVLVTFLVSMVWKVSIKEYVIVQLYKYIWKVFSLSYSLCIFTNSYFHNKSIFNL